MVGSRAHVSFDDEDTMPITTLSSLHNITITCTIGICACGKGPNTNAAPTAAPPATVEQSGTGPGPDSVFASFLSLVVATRQVATRHPNPEYLDSVWVRSEYGSGDFSQSYLLADYRVLSATVAGDTGRVTAAVTIAATLNVDLTAPKSITRAIGTIGIREDTIRFYVQRDSTAPHRWHVVEDGEFVPQRAAEPQVQFFRILADEWRPKGVTLDRAFGVVDSIRRARGKPLLR